MITKNITPKVHIKTAGEHGIVLLKAKIAMLALIILISVILIIYYVIPRDRHGAASNMDTSNVSYISVAISANDTLWSIAGRYYSDEFGTISDYVKEIKRCNSLKSDDIYAGRHIVVPVIYQTGDNTAPSL